MKPGLIKNFNKKTILNNLPYAISFVFLCLTMSDASFSSLAIFCLIGVILGVGCILLDAKNNAITKLQSLERKICGVFSVIIAVLLSFVFYSTWLPSSKVKSILGLISGNTDLLLRIGSVGFALLGCGAIFILVGILIQMTTKIIIKTIRRIDFRLLWKNIVSNFSFKPVVLFTVNIVIAALLGTMLLTMVYSIPVSKIECNVEESTVLIQNEGTYPSVFEWCNSQLDNFTDAIMLLEASNQNDGSAIEKAMQAYHGCINGMNDPYKVLVSHYVDGTNFDKDGSYTRYWHGYQVLLKPLLLVMNYVQIRKLNGIIQFLLFVCICFLLYKKGKARYILPYFITYLMLMPIALAESLQFSSCYYIFSIGSIVFLMLNEAQREKYYWLVFLNIGISLAFFDFLTYPIATFGIPAIIFVILEKMESLESLLSKIIKAGIAWCVGYIGMWGMKWAISSIVTGTNVFSNAFSAILGRTSHSSPDGKIYYSTFTCLLKNFRAFNKTPFVILLILLAVFTAYKIQISNAVLNNDEVEKKSIGLFLISLLPFLWYVLATNHSSIHCWFTNKALSVSAFAIGVICVSILSCCDGKRIKLFNQSHSPNCKINSDN